MAAPIARWCRSASRTTRLSRAFPAFFRTAASGLLASLFNRGVVKQAFPERAAQAGLQDLLQSGPQTVYCGFDPTAHSLHAGNLLAIIGLLHFRDAGHDVIAVLGGATARIGDPSGKTAERERLCPAAVERNARGLRENLQRVINNHELHFSTNPSALGRASVINNSSWYKHTLLVDFLSEVGTCFRMGTMLSRHSVQTRMRSAAGMSYTEFSYQLFQAFDFYHLHQLHGCRIQLGGTDQLGNIMSGHEFIHRCDVIP